MLENDNLSSVEDFQLFHSFISSIYSSIGSLVKEGGTIVIENDDEVDHWILMLLHRQVISFLSH